MNANEYSHRSLKDKGLTNHYIVKGNELIIPPKLRYYANKRSSSMISLLKQKHRDIELYIAGMTYYQRDMMPHSGKYYNRKKWLKKLGLWKYD